MKGSPFIKKLKSFFIENIVMSFEKTYEFMTEKKITMTDYLKDQSQFLPWLIRTMVQIRQQ